MATPFTDTLDRLIACFQAAFENSVIVRRAERPELALIEMQGKYADHTVHLREIIRADGSRKYAYYVLREQRTIVGFDNASDPRALRLKYSHDYVRHRLELVPHRHTEDKAKLELTGDMNCAAFVEWVKGNILRARPAATETGIQPD